jgi:HK97 family phage portal protein
MPIFGLHTKAEVEALLNAAKANETNAPHLLAGAGVERYEMPDLSLFRNQSELFRRIPAMSTAVEMLVDGASMIKVSVQRRMANEENKDVPNHPLELLLQSPNPVQSAIEFWGETILFRILPGNCYWWYNKASQFAPPDEIWIIPPDKITPVPDERLYLRGYLYDPGDGRKIPLETWEVEHFKRVNPFNRFIGLSVVEALAISAIGDIKANEWNTKLFAKNNARLPGILAFADPINDTDWTRLQGEVKDATEKREQIMMRGVGKGGVEWMQAAATQREMEFLEGRTFTKREIWDAIAPGLSSMLDPSATEASSKTGETVFRSYALYNRVVIPIESKLNKKDGLAQTYGKRYVVKFDDFRITDKAMELQERDKYDAVHTIEEIRKEYYGDKPLGDERDNLLPSELKSSGFGQPSQPEMEKPEEQKQMEETRVEDEEPAKSYRADLIKWREKARKRGAGKVTLFEGDIPADIKSEIIAELPNTKTNNDIKLLFAKYIHDEKNELTELLETALKAYIKTAV